MLHGKFLTHIGTKLLGNKMKTLTEMPNALIGRGVSLFGKNLFFGLELLKVFWHFYKLIFPRDNSFLIFISGYFIVFGDVNFLDSL